MDDPIDEKERKQEEILVVTKADITKRQIAEFVENQQRIERFAFQMPVTASPMCFAPAQTMGIVGFTRFQSVLKKDISK